MEMTGFSLCNVHPSACPSAHPNFSHCDSFYHFHWIDLKFVWLLSLLYVWVTLIMVNSGFIDSSSYSPFFNNNRNSHLFKRITLEILIL